MELEKGHPECDDIDPKKHIWYEFSYMWILEFKHTIGMV